MTEKKRIDLDNGAYAVITLMKVLLKDFGLKIIERWVVNTLYISIVESKCNCGSYANVIGEHLEGCPTLKR